MRIRIRNIARLTDLKAANAGVECVVGAGHVLQVAHGGEGEGRVPQAPPQDIPHTVRRQVSQAPDILHFLLTVKGLVAVCRSFCI
jgi:hypothetical protein